MPDTLSCSACGYEWLAPKNFGTQPLRCPKCGELFRFSVVPMPESAKTSDPQPSPTAKAKSWFYKELGKQIGPVTSAELIRLAQDGELDPATEVRKGLTGKWVFASKVRGLFDNLKQQAIPPTRQPAEENTGLETVAPREAEAIDRSPVVIPCDNIEEGPNSGGHSAAPELAPPPIPKAEWYYTRDGQSIGPITLPEIKHLLQSGQLTRTTLVWKLGISEWQVASSVEELRVISSSPQVAPSSQPSSVENNAISHCPSIIPDEGALGPSIHSSTEAPPSKTDITGDPSWPVLFGGLSIALGCALLVAAVIVNNNLNEADARQEKLDRAADDLSLTFGGIPKYKESKKSDRTPMYVLIVVGALFIVGGIGCVALGKSSVTSYLHGRPQGTHPDVL